MSDFAEKYHILASDESETEEPDGGHGQRFHPRVKSRRSNWKLYLVIAGLTLTNLGTLFLLQQWVTDLRYPSHVEGRLMNLPRNIKIPFQWYTALSSDNYTESDPLWENIRPSHGLVAVDSELAERQHLPNSTALPHNEGLLPRKVYLLESYHQIHCLRIIRITLRQQMEGQELTWPIRHAWHCIDTLRQSVQCNADSTALMTFGHGQSGEGQPRQCRDWDLLREWATTNSACYTDHASDSPFGDHYGVCDDGRDGLPSSTEMALRG